MCFYETSLETVQRAIESFKDHVRYIYAIDGKFEFYKSDEPLSSNEVRKYLKSIPNVILIDYPNRLEPEKRNVYIDLCRDNLSDWALMIDADEYITKETDWDVMYEHLAELTNEEKTPAIYGVTLKAYTNTKKQLSYPRLWRAPYLIKYHQTHNFFKFETDGKIYRSSTSWPTIQGIFMQGNDKLRNKDYLDKSYQYQLELMKYEKPLKTELRKIAENTKVYDNDPRLPPGFPVM